MRFADEILNLNKEDMLELIKTACDTMSVDCVDLSLIESEIDSFNKTLRKGLSKLKGIIESKKEISAEDMFLLYDTFGFPKDLTEVIAAENGLTVDSNQFEVLLEEQKERSRGTKDGFVFATLSFEKTEDSYKYDENVIENFSENIKPLALILNGEQVDKISENDGVFSFVFNKTCFYGECGGQVGDSGVIKMCLKNGNKVEVEVVDTKIQGGYVMHICKLLNVNQLSFLDLQDCKVTMHVNKIRRDMIRNNHSTCHIIGALIREVVDKECSQQGSKVDEFELTYDFNYKGKLTDEMIEEIEKRANEFVKKNFPVKIEYLTKEEVNKRDIIMMKNVKYPEPMRTIIMDCENEETPFKELCGGNHVHKTGIIGKIRIIAERGISAGIRRISVVTGKFADECDKNAKEAHEDIKNNKVVLFNKLFSVLEKRKIEFLNKEIIKKRNKGLQNKIKEEKEKADAEIKKIVAKMSELDVKKQDFYVKKVSFIDGDYKIQLKSVLTILNEYILHNLDVLVYMELEEDVLLGVFCKNENNYDFILGLDAEKLRKNKNFITGVVSKEIKDRILLKLN